MSETMKESLLLEKKKRKKKTEADRQKEIWFFKNGRRMKQNRTGQLERKKKLNIIKIQEFAELKSAWGEFGPDPPLCPGWHVESQFNLFLNQS